MNCSECDQPLARWGKWYWLCINCKKITFTNWRAELRATWFIFARYTLAILWVSMLIGIFISGNPYYTFIFGAIFGGFIGLSVKEIRRGKQ